MQSYHECCIIYVAVFNCDIKNARGSSSRGYLRVLSVIASPVSLFDQNFPVASRVVGI